jgi:hypothetical protein
MARPFVTHIKLAFRRRKRRWPEANMFGIRQLPRHEVTWTMNPTDPVLLSAAVRVVTRPRETVWRGRRVLLGSAMHDLVELPRLRAQWTASHIVGTFESPYTLFRAQGTQQAGLCHRPKLGSSNNTLKGSRSTKANVHCTLRLLAWPVPDMAKIKGSFHLCVVCLFLFDPADPSARLRL